MPATATALGMTTAQLVFASASLAVGVASAAVSGISQYQQAQAQKEYNEAQAKQYKLTAEKNSKAAALEYADRMAAERVTQMQEKKKAAIEIQQTQRETLQKQGTMLASTNAAGGTLNMLMQDYERQKGIADEQFRQQYNMAADAADISIDSYRKKLINTIEGQQGYVYMDSGSGLGTALISTGLGIGKAALGAYTAYNDNKAPSPAYTENSTNVIIANGGYNNLNDLNQSYFESMGI